MECNALKEMFLQELKRYNPNNFNRLIKTDLSSESPEALKCYSSAVTRYFIFAENHPEIPREDLNLLYYLLRIDLVAKYFSEYPAAKLEYLRIFQSDLSKFIEERGEALRVETATEGGR